MNFGIIGCGVIGQKRARALGEHRLVACADLAEARANALAAAHPGCTASSDPRGVIDRPDVEAVIVATTNDALGELAQSAAEAGKHVLVEKPGGRRACELGPVLEAAAAKGVLVKIGFNHRFHPALWQAHEIFEGGGIGALMYLRGRYGHGGRPGYDREWRADPTIAGGGEMLDQGIHLIDLSRWFAGEFTEVAGHVSTCYWQMPVEDNGFVSLRTASGQTAWLHASCTEWKNLFSFEIFGREGKLQIDGLGGSYGVERLTYYRMLAEMGPPETTIWEYPFEDRSWEREIEHFVACVRDGGEVLGTVQDGIAALAIVEEIYRQAGVDHHA